MKCASGQQLCEPTCSNGDGWTDGRIESCNPLEIASEAHDWLRRPLLQRLLAPRHHGCRVANRWDRRDWLTYIIRLACPVPWLQVVEICTPYCVRRSPSLANTPILLSFFVNCCSCSLKRNDTTRLDKPAVSISQVSGVPSSLQFPVSQSNAGFRHPSSSALPRFVSKEKRGEVLNQVHVISRKIRGSITNIVNTISSLA